MKMDMPKRKRLRLKGYDYSQNGAYFITLCVKNHSPLFGHIIVGRDAPGAPSVQLTEYGMIVYKEIGETPSHYEGVTIDNFVVMPNHIHMIVSVHRDNGAPRASRPTTAALIPTIIAALKKKTTKLIGFSVWQTSYHDHIIRSTRDYHKIWEYIETNPLQWEEDCFYCGQTKG